MYSCALCQKVEASQRCSKCQSVRYCDAQCQKAHWKDHKSECIPEVVQGIIIPCDGDRRKYAFFEPIDVPRSHPIHKEGEVTPVLKKVGVPLLVYKHPRPADQVYEQAQLDNQKTTYLMIEPASGFAPERWQKNIGTVTVIRADHKPLTKEEIEVLWMYCDHLLELFGDGPGRAHAAMTRQKFDKFCEWYKEEYITNIGRTEFEGLSLPIGRK